MKWASLFLVFAFGFGINVVGCASSPAIEENWDYIFSISGHEAIGRFHEMRYARWRVGIDEQSATSEYRSAVLEIDNLPRASKNIVSVKLDVFLERCSGVPFSSVAFTQNTPGQRILPQYMEFTSSACVKLFFYTEKDGRLNLEDQVAIKLVE